MADHKAEQIMAAVMDNLNGLLTTGAKVFRGRVWPLQDADMPGLLVYMGDDTIQPVGSSSINALGSVLTINIEARVKSSSQQLDTALNQIRKEVEIALLTTPTQGLAFVVDTGLVKANAPVLEALDKPVGSLRMEFSVQYRRSYADPSA